MKRAAEAGDLPQARYDSYLRIVETIEERRVPRDTDVEVPEEQIAKQMRKPSRHKRKQDLRRMAGRDLEVQDEEEDGVGS